MVDRDILGYLMEIGRNPAVDSPAFAALLETRRHSAFYTDLRHESTRHCQYDDLTTLWELFSLIAKRNRMSPEDWNKVLQDTQTGTLGRLFALLARVADQNRINRLGHRHWDIVSDTLTDNELVDLTKGLTIAENALQWVGGSVSAVIWTYRALGTRIPSDHYRKLADWLLVHRSNPYVPFGMRTDGVRSYAEFERHMQQDRIRRARSLENQKEEEQRQGDAKKHREARTAAGLVRQAESKECSLARRRVIDRLLALPAIERWQAVSEDLQHPIAYYPAEWAEDNLTILQSLPRTIRDALEARVAHYRHGVWWQFAEQLRSIRSQEDA